MSEKNKKRVPPFKDEAEEREFGEREDSSERIDWPKAERVTFNNLKPATRGVISRGSPDDPSRQTDHHPDATMKDLTQIIMDAFDPCRDTAHHAVYFAAFAQ